MEKKVHLTIEELVANAEEVLKRKHYQDRTIKIGKLNLQAGVKTLRINAEATGGDKQYELHMIFYKVSSSNTKDKDHPLSFKMPNGKVKYFQRINPRIHPVKVWCSGPWFQYASEWYLHREGSLVPIRKPRPYTKKPGSNRPSPNPNQLPCVCKHLYQLYLRLQQEGLVGR